MMHSTLYLILDTVRLGLVFFLFLFFLFFFNKNEGQHCGIY